MDVMDHHTIIPVAVFVYNRPELLSHLLDSLKKDEVPLLYIFSDGAKNRDDEGRVNEVRKKIDEIDWCEKIVYKQDSNIGLGKSIKSGVDRVLSEHTALIVFEDDLVFVKGTYNYLKSALIHFQYDERVMSVTGWTHPKIIPDGLEGIPYFDGKAECWSWGTWARAWKGMEKPALEIYNDCVRQGIDIEKYGSDMPKMALEAAGKNLWAIGWWYLHLFKGGLCLRPPYSLVETTGWDGSGTTITPEMKGWANPPLKKCPAIPFNYPASAENEKCPYLWKTVMDNDPMMEGHSQKIFNSRLEKIEPGIWIIENLLTETECHYLMTKANINIFKKPLNAEEYGRYNEETFIKNEEILNLLRTRLFDKINADKTAQFSIKNTTEVLEFYRYREGGFVSPHADTPIRIDDHILTNYTLVIYLNEDFEGGETFFSLNELQKKTTTGGAILFNQSLVHGGASVLQGNKYILRLCIHISGLD